MEKLTIFLKKDNKVVVNKKDIMNTINKTKHKMTKNIITGNCSMFIYNIKPKQEKLKKYKTIMIAESNSFKQITLFSK